MVNLHQVKLMNQIMNQVKVVSIELREKMLGSGIRLFFNHEDDETDKDDHLLPIEFNSIGQPIYFTKVRKIVRNIISPAYDDWRVVPWDFKEEACRSIKNVYRVPEIIEDKFLKMVNISWKNKKGVLRKV